MKKMMSVQERTDILKRILPLAEKCDHLFQEMDQFEEVEEERSEQKALREKIEGMKKEIQELLSAYLDGLPVRALSRCPFTGEVLSMAIDDFGIDGLWWNDSAPKRPENKLPETYFAIDGAMKLEGETENAPFLCSPGPDVPFVLPGLLEFTQVRAVISTIKIGRHTAFPIVYYADPMLYGVMRVNDWGTEQYWDESSIFPEMTTAGQYISLVPDVEGYDFDLAPWIRSGKLLWIAPGDETLTLHGHVKGCPYLDLQGSRMPKYIQNGKVWEYDQAYELMGPNDPEFDAEYFQKIIEKVEKGEI